MSEPLLTLSYQQKTEPDVRLGRVTLGCAILAMDAALLLMFRYVIVPMVGPTGAGGLGGIGGAGAMGAVPPRFLVAMITVCVYTLMSLCIPVAVALFAGGKLPRVQAGRVVGGTARNAAMAIAWVYFGTRLASGVLRLVVLVLQSRNVWPGGGDWRVRTAMFFDTGSALTLGMLQIAAWIYFADLAARLRRGAYLTLATMTFGISVVVMAVIFLGRIEQMAGGWYPPDVRSLLGWFGSDVLLCVVHLVFWSVVAGMLQGETRRGQTPA